MLAMGKMYLYGTWLLIHASTSKTDIWTDVITYPCRNQVADLVNIC